ncbi:molybdenum cofactor synthesis 1 [Planoprotostelium fungivorum]|uniref:GTP 3',8-cyclase n=1 Tax=Planoprotostelium fungivorum TaxID=1890364 RepID=A0A2P6MPZ9_9EUKA|nr:molybdenum cofactor synthesis 1 [Planoprotostelium fungivorum]
MCPKHALSRYKEKHRAHNNACLTTLWFSKQAGDVQQFLPNLHKACSEHKNAYKSLPTHKPLLASASVRHRLLSFSVQCFPPSLHKACSEHIKAYKCFAENLQTVHRKRAFSVAEQCSSSAFISDAKSMPVVDEMLIDTFSRKHNYLRISLTERCNLRCQYCMPEEGIELTPSENIMTQDEILRIATLFVESGVTKIRLTGGEPLVRKDVVDICERLGALPGLKHLGMTTNGLTLPRKIGDLHRVGVNLLNISLDTLKADKFTFITRRLGFERVKESIDLALNKYKFNPVKINCVVMKGFNDDEIWDFVEMTKEQDMEIRFIEYMPFGGNRWSDKKFISYQEIIDKIKRLHPEFKRIPEEEIASETSKLWKVPGYKGRIGFITSMSQHFCSSCNRLRLTADGNLKVCLFGQEEVNLKDYMRKGATDEELRRWIDMAVKKKKSSLGGKTDMYELAKGTNRPMILIGG